jgi:hypothetical protein
LLAGEGRLAGGQDVDREHAQQGPQDAARARHGFEQCLHFRLGEHLA